MVSEKLAQERQCRKMHYGNSWLNFKAPQSCQFSTVEVVQYTREITSVLWGDSFSTVGG